MTTNTYVRSYNCLIILHDTIYMIHIYKYNSYPPFFYSTQVFLMEQKFSKCFLQYTQISSLEHEKEFLKSFKIPIQKSFTQQM